MKSTDKDIIKTERMAYSKYKNEYEWNQTVNGSYDKETKTIEVVISCRTHYTEDK